LVRRNPPLPVVPLNEKRVKLSSHSQAICTLRFFYQNTLHRGIEIDWIPLPRYEKKLCVILSKAGVKVLLEAPRNLKHRAMLATMYGAGLRVSEEASLKISIWTRTAPDLRRPPRLWPLKTYPIP
jgi:integrase/recombinase XerD